MRVMRARKLNKQMESAPLGSIVATFSDHGCYTWKAAISQQNVILLKAALEKAIQIEKSFHRESDDPCQVVCCPVYDDIFLNVLRGELFSVVDALLGEAAILYSYNNSTMLPGKGNFSSKIHVERSYSTGNYLEMLGMMILLDDFTVDNGATWYLPGSQRVDERPDQTDFYQKAERLIAPSGSVFLFHPRLWHAGGINHTAEKRHALSIGFCQPYMKQRIDLVALLAGQKKDFSIDIKQKIGFYAKPPSTIADFYVKKSVWNGS